MKNYFIAIRSLLRLVIIKYICRVKDMRFTFKNLIEKRCVLDFERKSKIILGSKFSIRDGVQVHVRNGAEFIVGDNVFINSGCIITTHEKIEIGNGVKIGPNTIIYDHDHKFHGKEGLQAKLFESSPVIIEDNTWIGAGVIILRGGHIGKNCIIGAGSLIKGNIPDNSFVIQKRNTSIRKIEKDV